MAKSKMSSKYYGGDVFDENDEDSIKLLLKDCHQRQSALFSLTNLTHSPAGFFLNPPSRGELLYSSGQSRLHLYLREKLLHPESKRRSELFNKASQLSSNQELDFILFKKPIEAGSKLVDFPTSINEEAALFRSHGFPLLVWPNTRDVASVQQYLDENYPDCAKWYRELEKVLTWLEEKWKPLSFLLGLDASSSVESSKNQPILKGLAENSVATNFIKSRTSWNQNYATLLKSFFIHRRMSTPGFQHNPIHLQLQSLCNDRLLAVSNDAGFFNIAGNRLLQLGRAAEAENRTVVLKIDEMANRIQDGNKKAQFISILLPIPHLKKAFSEKNSTGKRQASENSSYSSAKIALIEALDASVIEDADDKVSGTREKESSDQSQSSDEEKGIKDTPKQLADVFFPNRPVSKEIMENRGIVKYRHKRERNPRVHLRQKFKKAQIRYKSRVPLVRKEETPYAGELRGIRVNMVKSHRFRKNK